jgi:hypothetical protein
MLVERRSPRRRATSVWGREKEVIRVRRFFFAVSSEEDGGILGQRWHTIGGDDFPHE